MSNRPEGAKCMPQPPGWPSGLSTPDAGTSHLSAYMADFGRAKLNPTPPSQSIAHGSSAMLCGSTVTCGQSTSGDCNPRSRPCCAHHAIAVGTSVPLSLAGLLGENPVNEL